MSLAKKIAYNTLTQIAGKIASTVLGLFSLALITRYLGPQGFGEYTTVLTFLGFFAVFADFGLTLVTVQLISDKRRDEGKVLNNLFAFRLLSVLIFLGLAPLIAIFLPYSAATKTGLIIAMAAFVFPALNQIIVGLFQKRLCMEKNAIAETVGKLILLAGILLGEKFNFGLTGILLATSFGAFVSFILHYLFSLKFAVIKLEWDFSLWKEVIIKFWPLAFTVILNLIYLRADTLLLSFFKSAEEVGFYGAPYKIIDVLTSLPFMFAGLILPILTTAWLEKKSENFQNVLQKSLDLMVIIALPIIIGTQFVAKETMLLAAGSEFSASSVILKILIFSLLAIFPGTIFAHAVIAIDKQKKMIPFYIFTSVTSLLAYLILIPKFSYFGATAVTIYSEITIGIFSAYCVLKYSSFKFSLKRMSRAFLASLIMGLFLYFSKDFWQITGYISILAIFKLALTIILASGIYLAFLLILKGVKKGDLLMIIKKQKDGGGQSFGSSTGI
ncbi:flippase [Patescibacteria group bacterium]|nr:flippase [Patescibacteria group bacterium]